MLVQYRIVEKALYNQAYEDYWVGIRRIVEAHLANQ